MLVEYDEASAFSLSERIKATSGIGNVIGLGTTDEFSTELAAETAELLSLRTSATSAIQNVRSKHKMREIFHLAEPDLNPWFFVVDSPSAVLQFAQKISFPLVIKPSKLAGSAYVKLCREWNELVIGLSELWRVVCAFELEGSLSILIEEYLEGEYYSVECINGQPIGIVGRSMGPLPHFVSKGNFYPTNLSSDLEISIQSAAKRALKRLSLTSGACHVETVVTKSGVKIIEINPRMAGNRIPELFRMANGPNYTKLYITSLIRDLNDDEISRYVSDSKVHVSYAASSFVLAPPGFNQLVEIAGLDKISSCSNEIEVINHVPVGSALVQSISNDDRVLTVAATGGDLKTARSAAEALATELKLTWVAVSNA